jgi:hypothetical protein
MALTIHGHPNSRTIRIELAIRPIISEYATVPPC